MKQELLCPHCKSDKVIKHGFRKCTFNDTPKYYCKKCHKFFSINNNFRMRYPKNIRQLALRLYEEKNSLRQISQQIYMKTHIKVSHSSISSWTKQKGKPYNYRYKRTCKICKRFITKGHVCDRSPAKKGSLYHCARCNQYLSKDSFNKDRTKKYGVMAICKKCRKPLLDKRNKAIGILRKIKRLNKALWNIGLFLALYIPRSQIFNQSCFF